MCRRDVAACAETVWLISRATSDVAVRFAFVLLICVRVLVHLGTCADVSADASPIGDAREFSARLVGEVPSTRNGLGSEARIPRGCSQKAIAAKIGRTSPESVNAPALIWPRLRHIGAISADCACNPTSAGVIKFWASGTDSARILQEVAQPSAAQSGVAGFGLSMKHDT